MRGLEIEARSGARSERAGPLRFKTVPRVPSSQDDRNRTPGKPKARPHPQRSRRSRNRPQRQRPSRRNLTRDRIDFPQRKRQALDDIATYRVVSVRDLVEQRFGGNAFAARKGIDALKNDGLLCEHTVRVKSGKTFQVLFASQKGRHKAWGNRKHKQPTLLERSRQAFRNPPRCHRLPRRSQRDRQAGKSRLFRQAHPARLRNERASVSKIAERARAKNGNDAAFLAKIEAAKQMHLSTDEAGKIHYPDARIEYENEQGSPGRVDVEVTSDNYRSKSLQAKISAGFKLYANGSASQRRISSALGLNESKSGGGGRGSNRDEELFEL